MSKPKSIPVPEAQALEGKRHHAGNDRGSLQQPLEGSKKVKNKNHVDHHNPEG